ncbi:MAG: type III secretion system export apparatus subunit SctU [Candidatus Methylacidiphilales bacterium]|nr:type III secretion system export apparatus subunit SctU [Candidatus Methylacidiphilales bacterium]
MSESGEKTEEPTAKKLRDAREKGQVAKSVDVSSTALLLSLFAFIGIAWDWYLQRCAELVLLAPKLYAPGFVFAQSLDIMLMTVLQEVFIMCMPVFAIVIVVGLGANFAQFGLLFSFESIKPDINKLNPMNAVKKVFSIKNLIEFGKSNAKIFFLGILVYWVILDSVDPLLKVRYYGATGVLEVINPIMKVFAINTAFAYIVVAAFDYFFQKNQHIKELRMTKDEVKREYKESEGNPEIKGKRKQLHKEMSQNATVQNTRKASVLVTNPTHYAVALYYNKDETKLPVVLSKGEGWVAQQMIKVAEEEGIPIMRDVPLARALYDQVPVEAYIPTDLIQPVAEVLRWVQQLKQQQGGGS